MSRFASHVCACLLFAWSLAATQSAKATDYGDIWWNPAEAGWGLQISHQGTVLFLTFYVYGSSTQPVWYTAAVTPTQPGGNTYSGQLIASTGSYYGAPWTGAQNRVAGTVTIQFTSVTTASVVYTVDGVTVNKLIERYAFNFQNLAGTYIGSFLAVQSNCANPLQNGQTFTGSGQFTIVHTPANQVTITAALSDNLHAYSCTYQGTYTQAGRLGSIVNGSYSCTDGHAGSFGATEIELASQGGILGRYSGTYVAQGCQLTGGFGGLKP